MKWSEIGGGLHIAWTHSTTTCKQAERENENRCFDRRLTQREFPAVTSEIANEGVKSRREEKTEARDAQHTKQHGRTK